jgi:hypothetical protein
MNTNPKEVKDWGQIRGMETTILPEHPKREQWPLGSFCAAQMDDFRLAPKEIKTALTRFRPPPSTGTPYLYRLMVSEGNFVRLNQLPQQCFEGFGLASDASAEAIVTAPIPVSQIEVWVGNKWMEVAKL